MNENIDKSSEEIDSNAFINERVYDDLYINLDGYEGPLDLLLHLAKTQKVDLKKLQIGLLADQYLEYLKSARNKVSIDSLADYLVVASWLAFLKSKLIIPEEKFIDDDVEKVNELLALRLQRLEAVRKYATILFERPQLELFFFPTGSPSEIKIIRQPQIKVELVELLRSYLNIRNKKNLEVSFEDKKKYLFLDSALAFMEKKLQDNKNWLLISDLASEIQKSSGAQLKSCVASIFCGSLEFVKSGKIEIRQNTLFGNIQLLER
jgi:segregation and condensation protein A